MANITIELKCILGALEYACLMPLVSFSKNISAELKLLKRISPQSPRLRAVQSQNQKFNMFTNSACPSS